MTLKTSSRLVIALHRTKLSLIIVCLDSFEKEHQFLVLIEHLILLRAVAVLTGWLGSPSHARIRTGMWRTCIESITKVGFLARLTSCNVARGGRSECAEALRT